jgi:putative membrane protein
MNSSLKQPQTSNLSDYLAAERTFLAWIRTGIAFMGFGFVVARFGLFLERLALIEPAVKASHQGLSTWFGTAMIVMGAATNCFSARHYVRLIRRLNEGERSFTKPSNLATATALVLAAVGLALAIYLISVS